jgi:hypothetical protein
MQVHDVTGKRIGTVSYVQFGDEDSTESGFESMMSSYQGQETVFDMVVIDAFGEDTDYNQIETYLLHSGYIRIDGGLFTNDRYATPDQIALLINQRIELNVRGEELVSL